MAKYPKKTHEKNCDFFYQKPWTNPFENSRFFGLFLKIYYSGLFLFVLYSEYKK